MTKVNNNLRTVDIQDLEKWEKAIDSVIACVISNDTTNHMDCINDLEFVSHALYSVRS